ncbi:MAG: thioredoxin family protein [bacterium]
MKTKIFLTSVFIVLLSLTYSYAQTSYSFNDGLNAAKSGGKKIFLDIYSEGDSWSKKMDSEIFSSSKVQSALGNFVLVKLNAGGSEKNTYNGKQYSSADLAKFFGGTGYPTFVVMNSDGSIIKFKYNGEDASNLSGFIGEEDFVEILNYFAQGKYKDTDLSSVFQN